VTRRLAPMLLLAALLPLAGCGLHLRGHAATDKQFAFHSIYIQAPAETTFTRTLRRGLDAYKLDVEAAPGKQELTLLVTSESTDKQITALNASGHVIEYLLHYRVFLRAYDRQQNNWLPMTDIQLQRILPYDDTLILAKQQEEQMLYDEMRADAAQQVLRRLAYARAPRPEGEEPGFEAPESGSQP
jgi:LPS-assembly lipoprotein